MNRNQDRQERRRRKRGESPMKKEREHPLVIFLTIIMWLGYGEIKDLYSLLFPYITEDPVKGVSVLLNIILLGYLCKNNKKKTRGAGL